MADKDIVRKAFIFALEAHGDQRYDRFPYAYHLYSTVEILKFYGFHSKDLVAAAWLHDVLEDTDVHYSEIKNQFGPYIAELVYALTDEVGRNRHEKYEKTKGKLASYVDALPVKLADKIANVEASKQYPEKGLYKVYKEAFPKFYEDFKNHSSYKMEPMWERLHKLFNLEYRARYDGLVS